MASATTPTITAETSAVVPGRLVPTDARPPPAIASAMPSAYWRMLSDARPGEQAGQDALPDEDVDETDRQRRARSPG